MNEAVGWSAVYVIVAFLSYKLTIWSWNMNIDKNVQPITVTILVPNYSFVNLVEYIIESMQL